MLEGVLRFPKPGKIPEPAVRARVVAELTAKKQQVHITNELLAELTIRVMTERHDIRDIVADYTDYCVTLGLTPSGRVHYDWAMERLGYTQHKALA